MKKLNSLNLGKGLSRSEMKNVFGGDAHLAACDSCSRLCHVQQTRTGSEYGFGMCSPATGGTSCHNYCCSEGQPTYWC